jgi:hypothetical protein
MKYDFWFELPKALINLSTELVTREEYSTTLFIEQSYNVNFNIILFIYLKFYRNTRKYLMQQKIHLICHKQKFLKKNIYS